MSATKFILKSKTILGIVIAAVPAVLGLFGIEAVQADVQTIADSVFGIIEKFEGIITLGGLALATYGRIKADKALTITK
jgi:hypothetical protein